MRFARYFNSTTDALLQDEIGNDSMVTAKPKNSNTEEYLSGARLRVLVSTVNSENKDNIELVSIRARAGYTAGYKDPEFIQSLPTFQLPFLEKERKYRMFQIDGDSMLPIPDRSYVIGEYIQDWHQVKDGHAYVFVTRDEGLVFKVAYNQLRKKKNFLLRSLNKAYAPYELPLAEVTEIWHFVNYTSSELPNQDHGISMLLEKLDDLSQKVDKFV
jgi:phage repressor protein C with HTH and peptisase S24 domain